MANESGRSERPVNLRSSRKLTAEIHDGLKALLLGGVALKVACANVDISLKSVKTWYAKGLQGHPDFVEFARMIDKSMSQAEIDVVTHLRANAMHDPKFAMPFLERRYPERWAKRTTIDLNQVNELALEGDLLDLDKLSEKELDALSTLLAKAQGSDEDDYIEDYDDSELDQGSEPSL